MPNRTPTNAKATRCKATEGAQQCLKAEHPKMQNHTWGSRGETPQWRADGTAKPDRDHTDQLPRVPEGGFVDVPESPMDAAAMQTPATPDPAPVGGYFNGDNTPEPYEHVDGLRHRHQGEDDLHPEGDLRHIHDSGILVYLPHPDETPRTVNTQQARELLANQEPGGALLGEVQEQARERGDLKPSATVDEDDRRDMERQRGHRHLIQSDGPRPVSVSGAPGSRLADVSSIASTLTLFGIPVELQDVLTWAQIAKHALDSIIEEVIRTRQPADPALITAALDAIDHIARARGLVRGGGS
jgi:hypothetical protein